VCLGARALVQIHYRLIVNDGIDEVVTVAATEKYVSQPNQVRSITIRSAQENG